MSYSRSSTLELLADALAKGARLELHLTPKPGLVDLSDCGSHPDLSVPIMERSIELLADYLRAVTNSLVMGEPLMRQRTIGLQAELTARSELGSNTHKGYLFLSGMLLIAHWRASSCDERAVREALMAAASEHFLQGDTLPSNGRQVRERLGRSGIVGESLRGFPSLFDVALPIYRRAARAGGSARSASLAMLAGLMQHVDDTTTLHRAGMDGLSRVKEDGLCLERLIQVGDDPTAFLQATNTDYRQLNITMGGVADMLGLAFGVLISRGELSPDGDGLCCSATTLQAGA